MTEGDSVDSDSCRPQQERMAVLLTQHILEGRLHPAGRNDLESGMLV